MSTPRLESFLARLYTDEAFLRAFLSDPHAATSQAALTPEESAEVLRINTADLEVTARSFARKRQSKHRPADRGNLFTRLLRRLRLAATPRDTPPAIP
ncbi:MAG: hypothetical protein HY820_35145 [Acidobacteria bacterium]|nr:hypothetical protein [Acidobacteriota bacterium]